MVLGFLSFNAFATDLPCTLDNLERVKNIAIKHSEYDKNRHCSVSCMLTLKCYAGEVFTIGVLKEIQDLFGPGEADGKDIKADVLGIELAQKKAATTDQSCLKQCDLYYPPREKRF